MLLGKLSDPDQEIRGRAVYKIFKLREKADQEAVDKDSAIQRFVLQAKQYHQMVSLEEITEPPAIRYMNEESLVQILIHRY